MRRDPVLHRARRLDIVAARGLAKFLTRPERGPYPVAQRLGQGIPMRSAPPCRGRNLSVATGPVTVMPMRPGVGRDSVPDMLDLFGDAMAPDPIRYSAAPGQTMRRSSAARRIGPCQRGDRKSPRLN